MEGNITDSKKKKKKYGLGVCDRRHKAFNSVSIFSVIPHHLPRENKFTKLTLPVSPRRVPDYILKQIRPPGTSPGDFS